MHKITKKMLHTLKIMKIELTDVFWFVLGFADMHETEKITFDHEPIGPMPKGYPLSIVLSIIISSSLFIRDQTLGNNLSNVFLGLLVGLAYQVIWVHVNWMTASLRGKLK